MNNTPTCVCGIPVHNGYLCHPCTAKLRQTISNTPSWADQLDIVRLRLVRFTDAAIGRHNAEKPLPFNPAATIPARNLDQAIRNCARELGAPLDILAHRLGVVCGWLIFHTPQLRLSENAPMWFNVITDAVQAAEKTCDRPPEHWYAGRCPCGMDLYPLVTEKMVTCPACAHAWSVEARRSELLRKVRDATAPGPTIARALSTLGDEPVTPEQLRKWRHAGRLKVRAFDPGPPATNWYRVGDVIDLVTIQATRRHNKKRIPT